MGRDPVGRDRRTRSGHERRRGHPLLTVLGALVGVVVLIGALALYWARGQITPRGPAGPLVSVVIPKGSSTTKIGSILAADGVVGNATLFEIYTKLRGAGALLAGTYHLHQHAKFADTMTALQIGPPVVLSRFVVPEGFTLAQIAARVGRLPGHTAAHFLAVATSGQVRSPYEPAGTQNLEGLVYPATYSVSPGEDDATIVQQMVESFDNVAASIGLSTGAAKLGLTPYQVITAASIVEREAKLDGDRGPIASVIYNRLRVGMTLGADSTLLYGLHATDPNKVDYNIPNPYNTRLNHGLPPTPISSPGLPSLKAALDPPTTSYLYFVVISAGGQTGFASTSSGFAQLQNECRAAKLC